MRVGRKVDNTRRVISRRALPSSINPLPVKKNLVKTVKTSLPPSGAQGGAHSEDPKPVMYAEKVHHRVLFHEVGKTIMEAGTLSHAFRALIDVLICEFSFHLSIAQDANYANADLLARLSLGCPFRHTDAVGRMALR